MTADDRAWLRNARGMTEEELTAFLAKPLIARVATVNEDGSPYVIPVWYSFDGRDITTRLRAKSDCMRNILRDPRIAVSIAEDTPPYPRVQILGRAEILYGPGPIEGEWLDVAKKNVARYLGEKALEYLLPTLDRPRYVVRFVPERVRAWRRMEWPQRYL